MGILIRKILLVIFVIFSSSNNCHTTNERIENSRTLEISGMENHSIVASRPFEMQTEVLDNTVSATAERSKFLWFFYSGSGYSSNAFRKIIGGCFDFIFGFAGILDLIYPYREYKNYTADSISGDSDLLSVAKNKAIHDNRADGIFIINISRESNWGWITRNEKVKVTGKLVKFIPIGLVSEVRFNRYQSEKNTLITNELESEKPSSEMENTKAIIEKRGKNK